MSRVKTTSYWQVFSLPAFRRFWLGFTFSMIGDSMTRVALTWFVYERTGSARALGLLTLAYMGPVVVGGLVAGPLLDRFDRRKVMSVDALLRGTAVTAIPVLALLGNLPLWVAYAAAAVYGSLMMISLAGGPALVPNLVPQDRLDTANALETLSFTLSNVIGPPLAGLLIAVIGAPNVVLIDALSYFGFALALAGIRLPEAGQQAAAAPASDLPHTSALTLADAVRLLLGNQILLSTTLMFMLANVANGFLTVWLPIYADRALGGGSSLYGLLLGVMAAGEVLSALLAGVFRPAWPLGTLIAISQFLTGLSLAIILLGNRLWLAGIALILFGFFHAPLTIWAQTLRMQIIPANLRGRAFALLRTLMMGAYPAGGALGGMLLPIVGMPIMIALSAFTIAAPGPLGLQVGQLRRAGPPQRLDTQPQTLEV